VQSWLWRA